MPDEKINQFVIELCRLAHELEGFTWRDRPDILATAVEKGQTAYADLLKRQSSLELSPRDATMIQSMMDTVKGRLRFLRRWTGS
ncbi:MAG TPA: hypothetical protein VJT08_01530 [Terriglobales bacterium]|nr:hypothetical protein [Terriglobales bacterium]